MTLYLPTTPRGSLLQNVSYVTKVTHYELTNPLKTENTPLRVDVLEEEEKAAKIFMLCIKFSLR
jgi:hypothetical protein